MAGHHAAQTRASLSDFESSGTADAGSHNLRWGENTKFGGYILADSAGPDGLLDVILIGSVLRSRCAWEPTKNSGQEVQSASLAFLLGLFEHQSQDYKDNVIPPAVKARVAVEQAARFGWQRYASSRRDYWHENIWSQRAAERADQEVLVSPSTSGERPPKRSKESNKRTGTANSAPLYSRIEGAV